MRILILFGALGALVIACAGPGGRQAVTPYPLDTCLVTGSTLGSMGDPVSVVYEGQEIKVCCAPCLEEIESSTEAFLSTLQSR